MRHLTNHDLHLEIQKLASQERQITHLILQHIAEIEKRKYFLDLGYSSMFAYLTKCLMYSEGAAQRRLLAARLLRDAPELKEKIEKGELKLNQVSQLQSQIQKKSISTTQKQKILKKLENQTGFQTEKILAQEFNLPIVQGEKAKPQSDNSIRLEITLTQEQWETLQQAKSDLSHIVPDGNLANVLHELAKRHLEKRNPKRPSTAAAAVEKAKSLTKSKRAYVFKHAKDVCQYADSRTKRKCDSRYQLQIDHQLPRAFGGANNLENLRVLCAFHNRAEALEWGLVQRKI